MFAGWCLSSQIPSAAPSSVGTATDQPISPIMPRPNQTPCVDLRALSLRTAFVPTGQRRSLVLRGFLWLVIHVERSRSDGEIQFPISPHQADASLVLVQGEKTPSLPHRAIDRGLFRRLPCGRKRARPGGLDQHPFIHGHQNFPVRFYLVDQNARTSAATQSSRCGKSPNEPSRVSATMLDTSILSAKIWNGRRTLRCMRAVGMFDFRLRFRLGFGCGSGAVLAGTLRAASARPSVWLPHQTAALAPLGIRFGFTIGRWFGLISRVGSPLASGFDPGLAGAVDCAVSVLPSLRQSSRSCKVRFPG